MKINDKMLSLPPYLSTPWSNVRTIHMKGSNLIISLHDGDTVAIPGLSQPLIDAIFSLHAAYLEREINEQSSLLENPQQKANIPINQPWSQAFLLGDQNADQSIRFGVGLEGMASALQHNSAQMYAPDLPKPILDKIAAIAKIVAPEDVNALPKAEPHCNCVHCQIARAITQAAHPEAENITASPKEELEEKVSAEDLNFQQWEISQSGEKLYTVINRLDTNEKYSVYLGHPVGCTCGRTGCEHILAVLKS
jgi:hypothetical protein